MRYLPLAALIAVSLTGCAGIDGRIERSAKTQGELEATKALPNLPPDCRQISRSGVHLGDRLDTALLKTDAALARQNARTGRCADWYDEIKAGFAGDQDSLGPQ